jgi:paraquat-inducible protein A
MNGVSAASRNLAGCHDCGLVSRITSPHDACSRCGARLHLRKTNSIARAWALLIASYILYVPANLLPIMETSSLFGEQEDTIMSGIVFLWHSGSRDLALVVFIASIAVPLSKLFALTYLLLSVRRRSTWLPLQKTRLYRVIEFVGKWSMLDIYVVALLATVVKFQSLANVSAAPGAVAFGAVVILTMLAAQSFDPRLIWDAAERGGAPARAASGSAPARATSDSPAASRLDASFDHGAR